MVAFIREAIDIAYRTTLHRYLQYVLVACGMVLAAFVYSAGGSVLAQLMPTHAARIPTRGVAVSKVTSLQPKTLETYVPDYVLLEAKDGLSPVISRVPTKRPVVFLTIDDGVYREPEAARKLSEAHIPATLFLVQNYTVNYAGYFADIVHRSGSAIEDHTVDHRQMTKLPFEAQKSEICTDAAVSAKVFGARPTLFRPPYGDYNIDTLRAATDCGMHAVVLWDVVVEYGAMRYQGGDHLVPGDIVLMHFQPSFKQDLATFVAAARAANLRPQLLEDWLTLRQ